MKRQILENEVKVDWCHFIGNRKFSLSVNGPKQEYTFTLAEEEVAKLEKALAEYRQQYPKQPEVPQTLEVEFSPGSFATMVVLSMEDNRTAVVHYKGKRLSATNLAPIGGGWRLKHYYITDLS